MNPSAYANFLRTGDLVIRSHGLAIVLEPFSLASSNMILRHRFDTMYFWTCDSVGKAFHSFTREDIDTIYSRSVVR